jgi:hypothetical protein
MGPERSAQLPDRRDTNVLALGLVVLAGFAQPARMAVAIPPLEKRIAAILPSKKEELWKEAGWRTHLMQARQEAQQKGRPIFLWIMVGNPQGAT